MKSRKITSILLSIILFIGLAFNINSVDALNIGKIQSIMEELDVANLATEVVIRQAANENEELRKKMTGTEENPPFNGSNVPMDIVDKELFKNTGVLALKPSGINLGDTSQIAKDSNGNIIGKVIGGNIVISCT